MMKITFTKKKYKTQNESRVRQNRKTMVISSAWMTYVKVDT